MARSMTRRCRILVGEGEDRISRTNENLFEYSPVGPETKKKAGRRRKERIVPRVKHTENASFLHNSTTATRPNLECTTILRSPHSFAFPLHALIPPAPSIPPFNPSNLPIFSLLISSTSPLNASSHHLSPSGTSCHPFLWNSRNALIPPLSISARTCFQCGGGLSME